MIIAEQRYKPPVPTANEDVTRFVTRHGIAALLQHATETVLQQFSGLESLTLSLEQDPDDDAEWLQLDAIVRSSPETVARAKAAFRKQLSRLAPGVDQSLVRLCVGVRAE